MSETLRPPEAGYRTMPDPGLGQPDPPSWLGRLLQAAGIGRGIELPPVQARPPEFSMRAIPTSEGRRPTEWLGELLHSPYVQDTLSQFFYGPMRVKTELLPLGVQGRVEFPVTSPRDITLQAYGSRQASSLMGELGETLAHEAFHTGSLTQSLNIPRDIQKRVLEEFWEKDPRFKEAAKGILSKEDFAKVPTESVQSKKLFPRRILRDREEALAYAFGEAMVALREGKDLSPEEVDYPGADIFLEYLRSVLPRKEDE